MSHRTCCFTDILIGCSEDEFRSPGRRQCDRHCHARLLGRQKVLTNSLHSLGQGMWAASPQSLWVLFGRRARLRILETFPSCIYVPGIPLGQPCTSVLSTQSETFHFPKNIRFSPAFVFAPDKASFDARTSPSILLCIARLHCVPMVVVEKKRRKRSGPWGFLTRKGINSIRYSSYLEDYRPCAGRLSAVNAIGTSP